MGVIALVGAIASGQRLYVGPDGEVPVRGEPTPGFEHVDAYFEAFLRDHDLPGVSVAIARDGRLAYARAFGWADAPGRVAAEPTTRFRIASISKPLTSVAVMRLVQEGRLGLDDRPFVMLGLAGEGPLPPGDDGAAACDARLREITVEDLLRHRAGFDRDASGDPMFMARRIARDMGVASPPDARTIVRWLARRPLDFDPGSRTVYSNAGYAVLGLLIEHVTGTTYEAYVRHEVLEPLGITDMRPARSLAEDRAPGEARYETRRATGRSVFDDARVDAGYGTFALEPMIAHGGWIASSVDLARFASAIGTDDFDAVLDDDGVDRMFSGPEDRGDGEAFYALGWNVRDWRGRGRNVWHTGSLPGTSTILVRRHDDIAWAVLFNSREGIALARQPAAAIDRPMHELVDRVEAWPEDDLFPRYLPTMEHAAPFGADDGHQGGHGP